ncbi:MAG: ABC transporter ATP-binding protein [Sulfolobales archaeon]|nr:ABC transporter ATP-binding protein [Sulfolobales archaeon]
MSLSDAIVVKDLVKVYPGGVRGADGVSFTVKRGEIYGLIGPNGAGKTTVLRILATVLQPTSGSARIFEYDVVKQPEEVRKTISYLPEEAGAYKYLSGEEYLEFIAKLYSSSENEAREMKKLGAEISGLSNRLRDKVRTYSKGMLRRLLVARAIMVKPKVAILDEPTSGLDVVNAVVVRDIIKKAAREWSITVLLSSHNMLEVEYLCSRIAMIHQGKIIAEGTPKQLLEDHGVDNLEELFVRLTGGRT